MQTTMENKDNMIARLEKELSTVQSKKTKAIEALAKLRLEKQKIAGESKGNEVVRAWAEAVVKARESYYGGLHCGDCFDVKVRDVWIPVRIEMDENWYLVGLSKTRLGGLTVRM